MSITILGDYASMQGWNYVGVLLVMLAHVLPQYHVQVKMSDRLLCCSFSRCRFCSVTQGKTGTPDLEQSACPIS